jgi:pantetheine-phosphate adenylyltransferase
MTSLFPGSFDPFTTGHADIVNRTLKFADRVVIAIGVHPTKKGLYSPDQRKAAIERVYKDNPRVEVIVYKGLTTDLAHRLDVDNIVRGVRNITDFEYERNIAEVNRHLTGIETVLLFADPAYSAVSSSVVRELMSYGKDVTPFLPTPQDINSKE